MVCVESMSWCVSYLLLCDKFPQGAVALNSSYYLTVSGCGLVRSSTARSLIGLRFQLVWSLICRLDWGEGPAPSLIPTVVGLTSLQVVGPRASVPHWLWAGGCPHSVPCPVGLFVW